MKDGQQKSREGFKVGVEVFECGSFRRTRRGGIFVMVEFRMQVVFSGKQDDKVAVAGMVRMHMERRLGEMMGRVDMKRGWGEMTGGKG